MLFCLLFNVSDFLGYLLQRILVIEVCVLKIYSCNINQHFEKDKRSREGMAEFSHVCANAGNVLFFRRYLAASCRVAARLSGRTTCWMAFRTTRCYSARSAPSLTELKGMRDVNNGPCDDRGRDEADMRLGVPIRGSATGNLVIDLIINRVSEVTSWSRMWGSNR